MGITALVAVPFGSSAEAARAPVPLAAVSLPRTLDWQPEYQGQKLCSDWAKPGAVKLGAVLRATYGSYTTYITRSCDTPGISEHEEGRAVDWMVDSEIPEQKAKAQAFLDWATAPGPDGELGAMARRLGIMYLIYNNKMWRAYRPEDGWSEYMGCSAKLGDSYDTTCHRDHIHVSLTWDGAYARTSFWTGDAETRGPCDTGQFSRPGGSGSAPTVLLDTDRGIGVPGDGDCRLAAGDSYRSRTYSIKVPVPAGDDPVEMIRLSAFDLDAPDALRIRSADTKTVPMGTKPGGIIAVPLNSDGVINFTVGAGYGQLRAEGLGHSAAEAADAPDAAPMTAALVSRVRLWEAPVADVRVNTPVVLKGRSLRAPKGSGVIVQRRLGASAFQTVATLQLPDVPNPPKKRRFTVTVPAVTVPGRYEYRTVLATKKSLLALSPDIRSVLVRPAVARLAKPATLVSGARTALSGVVEGAPAGAVLRVLTKKPKGGWVARKEIPAVNGTYTGSLTLHLVGTHRVQVQLVSGTTVWDSSVKRRIIVAAPPVVRKAPAKKAA